MPEVTAAAVKALRERTGLPMMECKKALQETAGDADAAVDWLRKQGIKTAETRVGRETLAGRIAIHIDAGKSVGAMIELQCESAPVAGSEDFIALANDLVKQLAAGPGAKSPAELLGQPSPGKPGQTLAQQKDDLFNRMREVMNLGRVVRIDGPCAGYAHHTGGVGVLVEFTGGNADLAKGVAMHIAASQPKVVSTDELDPKVVEKEREILSAAARTEGKPDNIIAKMVEGRLKNFYAECVLLEQPYIKEPEKTVGKIAAEAGMKVKRFVHWALGKN